MNTIPSFKLHQILTTIGMTKLSVDDEKSVKYTGTIWEIEAAIERLDSLQIEYKIRKKPIQCIELKLL